MKAARFFGPRDIRVEEVDNPECPPGHVIVRVRAAGICGGDLHEYRAGRQLYPTPYPRPAQGHELAGEVVRAAGDVVGVRAGARVAVQPMVGCGRCEACDAGHFALCDRLEHIGVARSGGFAELCQVPAANLLELPNHVSYEEAALLDCVAVAVHAVNRVPIRPGDSVAVIGTGTIGLLLVQLARISGAARVVAVGRRRTTLDLAARLGADETLLTDTAPRPADVVYETAGGAGLLARAAGWAGAGARVAIIGETFATEAFDAEAAMTRELTIAFVWSYGSWDGHSEYRRALELVAQRRIDLEPLITHRFPLVNLVDAFAAADARDRSGAVKVIVQP